MPLPFFPCRLIFPGVKLASDQQFTGFLEGLGPAQLAGRQTLATPPMGNHQSHCPISPLATKLLHFLLSTLGLLSSTRLNMQTEL